MTVPLFPGGNQHGKALEAVRTFAADPEALGGFSAWDYSVDAGATWAGPVDAATVRIRKEQRSEANRNWPLIVRPAGDVGARARPAAA